MIKDNYEKKNQMSVSFAWTCKTAHEHADFTWTCKTSYGCVKWAKEITFAIAQKPMEINFTWIYKISHDYSKCTRIMLECFQSIYNLHDHMKWSLLMFSCKINIFSLKIPMTQIFTTFIESPWFGKKNLHAL